MSSTSSADDVRASGSARRDSIISANRPASSRSSAAASAISSGDNSARARGKMTTLKPLSHSSSFFSTGRRSAALCSVTGRRAPQYRQFMRVGAFARAHHSHATNSSAVKRRSAALASVGSRSFIRSPKAVNSSSRGTLLRPPFRESDTVAETDCPSHFLEYNPSSPFPRHHF